MENSISIQQRAHGICGRLLVDLIPNPCRSDRDFDRFFGYDVRTLDARQLWAECLQVEHGLSRRFIVGRRARVIWVDSEQGLVSDEAWLIDRLARLRAEERRRLED